MNIYIYIFFFSILSETSKALGICLASDTQITSVGNSETIRDFQNSVDPDTALYLETLACWTDYVNGQVQQGIDSLLFLLDNNTLFPSRTFTLSLLSLALAETGSFSKAQETLDKYLQSTEGSGGADTTATTATLPALAEDDNIRAVRILISYFANKNKELTELQIAQAHQISRASELISRRLNSYVLGHGKEDVELNEVFEKLDSEKEPSNR